MTAAMVAVTVDLVVTAIAVGAGLGLIARLTKVRG